MLFIYNPEGRPLSDNMRSALAAYAERLGSRAALALLPTERTGGAMLGWMDDSPKRTAIEKIRAAMRAFEDRFGVPPNVARVHQANAADVPGVNVIVEHWVNKHNIFVERV